MRYCLNTSTIREQALSLPDTFNLLADIGYDAVEPWVRELDAFIAGGGSLSDLRQQAEDHGLAIPNLIGFFQWSVDDETERTAGFEEARRCFQMAAELGCPMIAAPPMGWTKQGGLDLWNAVARYRELCVVGREYGVVPILEFWGPAQSLGHLGEALMVVAESGCEEACLLADVYHMYKKGTPHSALAHCGPRTIGLVHVNDYPADPPRSTISDADRVMPGDGIADWQVVFNALAAAGYDGYLSLEIFNQHWWATDARETCRVGLEKMRALVEQNANR